LKRTICIVLTALLCLAGTAADKLGLSTVVIDAGHGGKDAGCVSADGKTYEKTLTLDIAKTLAGKIRAEFTDVRVVLTRSKDETVGLDDRAAKANAAGADLFISIHINANPKSSPNGYSVHVLGQSSNKNRDLFAGNMEVCRRENSVILLEDDYSTKYQGFDPSDPESYIFMVLMQNSYLEQSLRFAQVVEEKMKGGPFRTDRGVSQDPFYVLWKTSMPAVLVELGFISNSSDLAILKQKSRRDEIAGRLFDAFKAYKEVYDGSMNAAPVAPVDKVGAAGQSDSARAGSSQPEDASGELYGIQIFAVGRKVGEKEYDFLGYTPRIVRQGKLYKYYICVGTDSRKAASELPAVKKKYPDAFVARIPEK
jgi:N-acetylmuramoyl-L-alanine amidase